MDYLGFQDGEAVRDTRTGLLGHVRVFDDEEVGRYAEVKWFQSFVSEELELAIDNGLTRYDDDLDREREIDLERSDPPDGDDRERGT